MKPLLSILTLIGIFLFPQVCQAEELSYDIDKAVYAEVEKAIAVILNIWEEDRKLRASASKEEIKKVREEFSRKLKAALDNLLSIEKPNEAKVISHLLIYQALARNSKRNYEDKMLANSMIMSFAIREYSSREILSETVKYLEVPDRDFKQVFYKFHRRLLESKNDGELEMFSFTLGADKLPAKGLVDFLYSLSISKAAHLLARNYSQNNEEKNKFLKQAQLIIENSNPDKHVRRKYPPVYPKSIQVSDLVKDEEVINALHKLSGSGAWWQRNYAVNLLKVIPEYRIPAIVERLRKDDHPLIRGELEFLIVSK